MQRVIIFEGGRAVHYDQNIFRWIPDYHAFHQEISLYFQNQFNKEVLLKILVAGCGTGREIKEVNLSDKWQITGFDPSVEMIRQAQVAYENQKNLSFVTGTIDEVQEDSFDVATLMLVLHFLSDDGPKLELLTKICNKLKAGGTLLLVDIYKSPDFDAQMLLLEKYVRQFFTEDQVAPGVNHIRNDINHIPEYRLRQLVLEAGFSGITQFKKSYFYGGWIIRK